MTSLGSCASEPARLEDDPWVAVFEDCPVGERFEVRTFDIGFDEVDAVGSKRRRTGPEASPTERAECVWSPAS